MLSGLAGRGVEERRPHENIFRSGNHVSCCLFLCACVGMFEFLERSLYVNAQFQSIRLYPRILQGLRRFPRLVPIGR
jgi:hypothetical protein